MELDDMRIGLIDFDTEIAHSSDIGFGKGGGNAASASIPVAKDCDPTYLRIAKVMAIGIPFHLKIPFCSEFNNVNIPCAIFVTSQALAGISSLFGWYF